MYPSVSECECSPYAGQCQSDWLMQVTLGNTQILRHRLNSLFYSQLGVKGRAFSWIHTPVGEGWSLLSALPVLGV